MKTLKYIHLILFVWILAHLTYTAVDGLTGTPPPSDFAVVFGNTVNPDGSLSPRLKARVDKSLELYEKRLVKKIFVSGGIGKEGHPEGTRMAEYLRKKGIPPQDILTDDKGNNTRLTAQNFVETQGKKSSVIVVSQYYHLTRAKLAFAQEGLTKVSSVSADYHEKRDAVSLLREFLAYYKYLLFP
ncbi:hypothetical protein FUAX_54060 (plasmid) [Fulvitalea axinellae]|uniref:DUF218 domain-containing protein n=1 Tax=Fulvitalea axinellae TaxID=1182444 RepID=A0AAU9CLX3_9BACT|nr:hypothetical protein FUAX_54060 [Fulvitalea axinellae]